MLAFSKNNGRKNLWLSSPLDEASMSQNIMVVAFECMDKTEEANLFVTINHEQKTGKIEISAL